MAAHQAHAYQPPQPASPDSNSSSAAVVGSTVVYSSASPGEVSAASRAGATATYAHGAATAGYGGAMGGGSTVRKVVPPGSGWTSTLPSFPVGAQARPSLGTAGVRPQSATPSNPSPAVLMAAAMAAASARSATTQVPTYAMAVPTLAAYPSRYQHSRSPSPVGDDGGSRAGHHGGATQPVPGLRAAPPLHAPFQRGPIPSSDGGGSGRDGQSSRAGGAAAFDLTANARIQQGFGIGIGIGIGASTGDDDCGGLSLPMVLGTAPAGERGSERGVPAPRAPRGGIPSSGSDSAGVGATTSSAFAISGMPYAPSYAYATHAIGATAVAPPFMLGAAYSNSRAPSVLPSRSGSRAGSRAHSGPPSRRSSVDGDEALGMPELPPGRSVAGMQYALAGSVGVPPPPSHLFPPAAARGSGTAQSDGYEVRLAVSSAPSHPTGGPKYASAAHVPPLPPPPPPPPTTHVKRPTPFSELTSAPTELHGSDGSGLGRSALASRVGEDAGGRSSRSRRSRVAMPDDGETSGDGNYRPSGSSSSSRSGGGGGSRTAASRAQPQATSSSRPGAAAAARRANVDAGDDGRDDVDESAVAPAPAPRRSERRSTSRRAPRKRAGSETLDFDDERVRAALCEEPYGEGDEDDGAWDGDDDVERVWARSRKGAPRAKRARQWSDIDAGQAAMRPGEFMHIPGGPTHPAINALSPLNVDSALFPWHMPDEADRKGFRWPEPSPGGEVFTCTEPGCTFRCASKATLQRHHMYCRYRNDETRAAGKREKGGAGTTTDANAKFLAEKLDVAQMLVDYLNQMPRSATAAAPQLAFNCITPGCGFVATSPLVLQGHFFTCSLRSRAALRVAEKRLKQTRQLQTRLDEPILLAESQPSDAKDGAEVGIGVVLDDAVASVGLDGRPRLDPAAFDSGVLAAESSSASTARMEAATALSLLDPTGHGGIPPPPLSTYPIGSAEMSVEEAETATPAAVPAAAIVSGKMQHVCKYDGCGYTSLKRSHVTRHEIICRYGPADRTIEEIKPFQCPFKGCHFRTSQNCNLCRHMRVCPYANPAFVAALERGAQPPDGVVIAQAGQDADDAGLGGDGVDDDGAAALARPARARGISTRSSGRTVTKPRRPTVPPEDWTQEELAALLERVAARDLVPSRTRKRGTSRGGAPAGATAIGVVDTRGSAGVDPSDPGYDGGDGTESDLIGVQDASYSAPSPTEEANLLTSHRGMPWQSAISGITEVLPAEGVVPAAYTSRAAMLPTSALPHQREADAAALVSASRVGSYEAGRGSTGHVGDGYDELPELPPVAGHKRTARQAGLPTVDGDPHDDDGGV